MPRIQLTYPDRTFFSTTLPIRITDINFGGHLAHDKVLSMVHEARAQSLISLGYSEKDIGGCGIIMGDCAIVYQSEAFYGQSLKIDIAFDESSRCGFAFYYRITRIQDAQITEPVALVKTGMVCFDYHARKPCAIPRAFLDAIRHATVAASSQ